MTPTLPSVTARRLVSAALSAEAAYLLDRHTPTRERRDPTLAIAADRAETALLAYLASLESQHADGEAVRDEIAGIHADLDRAGLAVGVA